MSCSNGNHGEDQHIQSSVVTISQDMVSCSASIGYAFFSLAPLASLEIFLPMQTLAFGSLQQWPIRVGGGDYTVVALTPTQSTGLWWIKKSSPHFFLPPVTLPLAILVWVTIICLCHCSQHLRNLFPTAQTQMKQSMKTHSNAQG